MSNGSTDIYRTFDSLAFAGRSIPLDYETNMLINYTNDSAARLSFEMSFVDVLKDSVNPDVFRDKIVIIGATATGLGDIFLSPMGLVMHGVEIHASAIHTILAGNFLRPAPASATIVSILLLAFLCGLAVLRFRTTRAVLCGVFLFIVYWLVAFTLLPAKGLKKGKSPGHSGVIFHHR